MSRIGKSPISIPDKVQLKIEGKKISAKGPLGELSHEVPDGVEFTIENNVLTFSRNSDVKHVRALHGLTRALVFNMITGVNTGFERTLNIVGVGYKAEMKANGLFLTMGFSHPILIIPPKGVKFEAPNPTTIKISGIDKQLIGQISAKVRAIRPPEPYKGKGIAYAGEYIRRKAGKTASK
ncbi:MAG: 50S ribosomal protein L6 [Chloroflexota bacterium]